MGGWAAQTRWQKAGGHGFPVNQTLTPEAILSKWDVITSFGGPLLVSCLLQVLTIVG